MFKKIFNIILITLFIIIGLELFSRIFKISNLMGIDPKLVNIDNRNFHRLSANSSGKIFNNYVITDNYGYRIPRKGYEYKKLNKVFFIGDSVTLGNGVDEEKTFVGLLRKNSQFYEIINSSVFGYQIYHFVQRIEEIDNFEEVKKIIYVLTLNDIFPSSNIEIIDDLKIDKKYRGLKNLRKFINVDYLHKANAFLRNKSYLYMYLKGKIFDPSKNWFNATYSYYIKYDLLELENFLVKLTEKSKNLNSELNIVLLPYEFQTRNCLDKFFMPQRKIKTILKKNKIKFYDFSSEFCNEKNPNKLFYKFDPMHLSEKGHKFTYKLLKNAINF